jgi:hypothetical protein
MSPTLALLETLYTITRTSISNETDSIGRKIPTTQQFELKMFAHRAKRSDFQYQETAVTGANMNLFAKVRVRKIHGVELEVGDTFVFQKRLFEIIQPNLYQDEVVDFYSYMALEKIPESDVE